MIVYHSNFVVLLLCIGRRNHRVSFRFTGKLTCGDRCRKHTDNQNSRENVVSRRHDLRSLIRTKPTANINYLGRQVVLHYFRGSKSNFPFVCPANLITGSLTRRLPLCGENVFSTEQLDPLL